MGFIFRLRLDYARYILAQFKKKNCSLIIICSQCRINNVADVANATGTALLGPPRIWVFGFF